ncbi:MAG: hypothetical protein HQK92_06205 [Nitrospirae bacterium]|nr:hypothetical protein [Nitrospirota bacterium]
MIISVFRICFIVICLLIPFRTLAGNNNEYNSKELINGDFTIKENNKPKAWHFHGSDGMMTLDSQTSYKGNSSLKLSLDEKSDEEIYIEQSVDVEASKLYEIAGVIKSDKLENSYAGIIVIFKDKNGKTLKHDNLPYVSKTTNWIYQSKWIRSPNNSEIAIVKCFLKGTGVVWFNYIYFSSKIRGGY